jgi:hypothetical protein
LVEARSWYQKSVDLWKVMKEQGIINSADADKLAQASREIQHLDRLRS